MKFFELFERTYKQQKGTEEFVDNMSKTICKSYTSTFSNKYDDELSIRPEFDHEAWIEAIRRPNNTWTHVYGFGTRVLVSRLLALNAVSKFACGLDVARPSLALVPELEGYRQLISNVYSLMMSMGRINNLFEVIANRLSPSDTFESSSSQQSGLPHPP